MRQRPLRAALVRIACLLVCTYAVAPALAAQGDDPPVESAADRKLRLEYAQQRARELMGELEDRMFQLSESIRSHEPDDAARLVLGLRKSREELIIDEMEQIAELIKAGDFDAAEERQRQVVFRLGELRELLLSMELDLLLKLERLRKINAALGQLGLVREEHGRQGELLAKIAAGEVEAEKLEGRLRGAALVERENQQLVEVLASAVGEVATGGMQAVPLLEEALEHMGTAARAYDQRDADAARAAQEATAGKLEGARADLAAARDELLWELQPYIRRAAIDAVARIRDVQDEINVEVEAGLARAGADGRAQLEAKVAKRLADLQQNAEDTARNMRQLSLETDFSETVPQVLFYVQFWNKGPLQGFREAGLDKWHLEAGQRTKAMMDATLKILLEEEQRWRKNRRRETRKMIKLISELKGARAYQGFLRQDTTRLEGRRGVDDAPADLEEQILAVSEMESGVTDMLEVLDERYWAELLDQEQQNQSDQDD
jgi:hypothetical protein